MDFGPMQIEVTRGAVLESIHSVDVVVSEVEGPVLVWGAADRPIFPRSAAKLLQVMPLLRTGAAEAYGVTDEEVALACASHSGEPSHVEAVAAWLRRLGFGEDDLECGPDLPLDECTRQNWLMAGKSAGRLANCCSGKHAGFLTIARHHGWGHSGYIDAEHEVQRLVTEALEQFCDVDLAGTQIDPRPASAADSRPALVTASYGVDGCGIPTWSMPLDRLALGMARLASPDGFDGPTAAAARTITTRLASQHFWLAGTNRFESRLAAGVPEPALFKSGAEGVFVAVLPNRGIGIAVKVRDGADRAAQVALAATLVEVGALTGEAADDLTATPVHTKVGKRVGTIRRA